MTFRAATDDDFEAIAAITNYYVTTTAIHFAYQPVATAEFRAMWHKSRERHPWLVAETAGQVVGYAKSGTWRKRDAYHWTCEVGLYIADRERGHGLGTTLYMALLDECARRGFRSAVAGITLPNDASVALHDRLGFTPTGVVRDAGWKNGAWHDVAFYQKRFTTSPAGPAGAS